MAMCINEMNVKNRVVFIAGKGFFSAANIAMMNEEKLSYIIPLHRTNSLIDFSPIEK
jgi:transposase